MAHNSIGLDLGSNEVRAAVVRVSLRSRDIIQLEREPVKQDASGVSSFSEILAAAGRLMRRIDTTGAGLHCAVTGELAAIRKVILPVGAAKKLDQVLRFELDEVLPFAIDDAVYDYVETERTSQNLVLLTASVLQNKVENLINGLAVQNIAPREIGVDSFSYLNRISAGETFNEVTAFVDIGHSRTNIAVLDSNEPTVRTVLRGGRQLTLKLVEAGSVDYERAEMYKREFGLTGKIGEVIRESLRPLVREIQQTFKGHLASGGRPVEKLKLCGGGALLKNLDSYLSESLGIPVELYELPAKNEILKHSDDASNTVFTLAYMLALREEVPQPKRINVRRGSLAFKGDYEFLKSRIKWVAIGATAILLSWGFSGYAAYKSMADSVQNRKIELEEKTKHVFGKALYDHTIIAEKLKGSTKEEKSPVPKIDAFEIVVELSKRIPESIVHDIEQIEIKPKRVTIKGLISPELKKTKSSSDEIDDLSNETDESSEMTLSPTDLLKQKLEEFKECFTAIRMGRISSVNDKRRYQMDIDSRCP